MRSIGYATSGCLDQDFCVIECTVVCQSKTMNRWYFLTHRDAMLQAKDEVFRIGDDYRCCLNGGLNGLKDFQDRDYAVGRSKPNPLRNLLIFNNCRDCCGNLLHKCCVESASPAIKRLISIPRICRVSMAETFVSPLVLLGLIRICQIFRENWDCQPVIGETSLIGRCPIPSELMNTTGRIFRISESIVGSKFTSQTSSRHGLGGFVFNKVSPFKLTPVGIVFW